MNRLFLFFLLILVVVAASLGVWYWKGNEWTKGVLKLEVLGPQAVQAGQEIKYLVKFKNNGQVRLEEAKLVFEYPENILPLERETQRITQELEDIYPGEERTVEFKGRAFGKEGDVLEGETFLTYRPKNLKASYESKTTFSTQISSVPLTFEFDLPLKAETGEDLNFSLNYFSNIDYVLENLRARIQYPNGFTFVYSKPQSLDETEFLLPSLYQVDGGRINIQGRVDGRAGEKKVFRAQLGVVIDERFVVLTESSQAVEMAEPSFYVSQFINGSQSYTATVGEMLHYEVFFKNIGKKPIQKKFLFVKLEGDFFDLSSLNSDQGEFGTGDNTILFDWKNVSDLRFLDADEEGKVEFWVKVKESTGGGRIRNPLLKNVVTIGGTEKVFEAKINAKIYLAQKVYFQEEVFGNKGPLPPRAGTSTSYTVFWQIENSWNTLENVKVRSILPSNVKPTGNIFPEDAKLTYDSSSRELVWTVGNLEPFQGSGDEVPLTLAFQIELTPNESQRDKTALLIEEAEISGQDIFTSELVSEKAIKVDTSLPDDETVTGSLGIVR